MQVYSLVLLIIGSVLYGRSPELIPVACGNFVAFDQSLPIPFSPWRCFLKWPPRVGFYRLLALGDQLPGKEIKESMIIFVTEQLLCKLSLGDYYMDRNRKKGHFTCSG